MWILDFILGMVGSGIGKDVGCGENGEGGLLVVVVVVRIRTNAGSKAI